MSRRPVVKNRLSANRRQYMLREAALDELAELSQEAGMYENTTNPIIRGAKVTELVIDELVDKDEDGRFKSKGS